MSDTYFAAESESQKCVAELLKRMRLYREAMSESGRTKRMLRAWRTHYGYSPDGNKDTSMLSSGGDRGELVNMNTNHFAGLINQTHVMVTSSKPAFRAVAANTDYSIQAQTQLAEGLIDYVDSELTLNKLERDTALKALLLSEGYLALLWNPSAGEAVGADDTGRVQYEGGLEVESLTPFDVAFDPEAKKFDSLPWICFRRRLSKFDLAAQYPKSADKLKSQSEKSKVSSINDYDVGLEVSLKESKDLLDVWEFRHRPTPALPSGRLIRFVDDDCILFDTIETNEMGQTQNFGYPYEQLHVERMTPELITGTVFGHTPFFDLLSLQEGVDMVATIAASAINAGGLMNLWLPEGHNLNVDHVAGGLNILTSNAKPEAIDAIRINPEVKDFAQACISWMRQRTGINSVVAGEPDKGMPAQAMALLHAQALQFHSSLQFEYQRMLERIRTGILKMFKRFAKSTRIALMAGKSEGWALKEFSGKDIAGVDRIMLEAVNPTSKTMAGKQVMMDNALHLGAVTKDDYKHFMATGEMKSREEDGVADDIRLKYQIEQLQQGIGIAPVDPQQSMATGSTVLVYDGKPHVQVMASDPHWSDIPKMLDVLATPGARENPEVIRAVRETVAYKLELWRQMDPAILMIKGGPPCPPKNPTIEPPQVGLQPTETMTRPPAPGSQSSTEKAPIGDLQAVAPETKAPNMPRPPPNPLTGEKQPPVQM